MKLKMILRASIIERSQLKDRPAFVKFTNLIKVETKTNDVRWVQIIFSFQDLYSNLLKKFPF